MKIHLVLESDGNLIEDRLVTSNVKGTALQMLLDYSRTLPAEDPPSFWIYVMANREILCEYVLYSDTELKCQEHVPSYDIPGRPDVARALDTINRHRRAIGQAPLDPAAAGWDADDILAEADTIRRLHNGLKRGLLQ